MSLRNPFISRYVQQFSLLSNNLVAHNQGPIHINAYPNQVCAYYLDSDKCLSFKIDPELKKRFIVKSKKFLVKTSTRLGTALMKDGSTISINAVNGQLLELHDVEQAKDE